MTVELKTTLVDLGLITHVIPDDQEPTSLDPHDELLQWHYHLGHLSFECIKQLAWLGQLPKRLLASKKPFCSACQYGKMMKHPWRVKGDDKNATKTATWPGQIVSGDQLESNSLGFIAQLKGKLTQQWYKYAMVFIDQFSGYTFVYLQRCITSEETVMAKHAFERAAEQRGIKILHYHTDNGRFADNAFIADCNAQRQILLYCGVNAHFQNSIAEQFIRDLQEQTRTSMLYAMNKWKRMILICQAIGEVLRCAHQAKAPPLPCIWMPHVCTRQCATERARHTQMEASLLAWSVSWPIAKPCPIGGPSTQPMYGPRFTAVPC